MNRDVIIPAQLRAARALVSWSQEALAEKAEVGLSTIRDLEAGRRSDEVAAMKSVVGALHNEVTFLPGTETEGPGVRLCVGLPNVIVEPKGELIMDMMKFTVEHIGKRYIVLLDQAPLDDLDERRDANTDAKRLKAFGKHRRAILERTAKAIANDEAKPDGRLYLSLAHFRGYQR